MKVLTLIMVTLMIASAFSEETKPTSCYVCNSINDPSCGDENGYKPKDVHKQECTNGETFCRKIVQSGKF
jgi:hypothetical protein